MTIAFEPHRAPDDGMAFREPAVQFLRSTDGNTPGMLDAQVAACRSTRRQWTPAQCRTRRRIPVRRRQQRARVVVFLDGLYQQQCPERVGVHAWFCGACLREVYAASLARPAGRAAGVVFLGARSVFLFGRFEKLVTTYPEARPATPPRGFFAFLWACTAGMRPYLVLMTVCTAIIGAFEALLFAMLGQVVDWLSRVEPAQFWVEERRNLILLAAVLALSPLVVALFALLKYQTLLSNFPMRLRWNFHRLMLGQSMSFYQDEFAGRVATKVMQTALAVRDAWITATDILAFITIYFVTMLLVVGSFDFGCSRHFSAGWRSTPCACDISCRVSAGWAPRRPTRAR